MRTTDILDAPSREFIRACLEDTDGRTPCSRTEPGRHELRHLRQPHRRCRHQRHHHHLPAHRSRNGRRVHAHQPTDHIGRGKRSQTALGLPGLRPHLRDDRLQPNPWRRMRALPEGQRPGITAEHHRHPPRNRSPVAPTKNGDKRPKDYSHGSKEEVYWQCPTSAAH